MDTARVGHKLISGLWRFIVENKAYFIVPFVLVLIFLIVVLITGQTSAPFIYT